MQLVYSIFVRETANYTKRCIILCEAIISIWKGPEMVLPLLSQRNTSCHSSCAGSRWAPNHIASQW